MGGPTLHRGFVWDAHRLFPSVVVAELDIVGVTVCKPEAKAKLVVDRDRVRPLTVAFKQMEAVAGRDLEVLDPRGRVHLFQLARSSLCHLRWHAARFACQVQLLRLLVSERLDHGLFVTCHVMHVNDGDVDQ